MEVELLWPLIQELVGEGPVSEEDWAFLKQSAEPLECPEPVVQALIGVRQNVQRPEVTERLRALTAFIEALGSNASRKLSFILELTEYLHLPVEIVQVLIQVPRRPVLSFLSRLWRALPRTGERAVYEEWFHGVAGELGLEPEMRRALIGLLEAVDSKQPVAALRSLWSFLSVLPALPELASEKSYLMDLAREARLSDALVKGMETFIRLREKGQSPIASLGEVIQVLLEKGALGPEDHELLALLAGEGGISMSLLQAMMDIEEAIRAGEGRKGSGRFAAEVLEPFLREVLSAHLESESRSYIEERARRLGLTSAQLEAIIELEKRLVEKSAKFPQHIQPLIHVLVEKGEISDEKLLYLARKAQEMGGSEKVVRTLVQIEITAQRKAARSSPLQAPSAEPAPISAESAEPPRVSPPPPPEKPAPVSDPTPSAAPIQTTPPVSSILPQTFPKGGNFPTLKASFSSVVAFSLRSEKDRIRKSEIFAKGGRAHWYALIDFEGSESLLILKGKPEQRVGEILQVAASPTGDVLALKERVPGGIRVIFNGDPSVPYEEVGSFVFSPNGRHMAYVAVKGQDQFPALDNIPFRPFLYITELTFHPTAESDLYYIAQTEKNKWFIWDHLGQPRSEAYPAIRLLTFSPDGKYMAYAYLKNRKFQVFDGKNHGPAYDSIGDLQFTPNSAHIFYSAQKGKTVEVLWDHHPLCAAEGIASLTPAPSGEFIAYIAREKDGQTVYMHNKKLGTYDKVERLLIPKAPNPTVIYIVEHGGRHHIFINGAPESGPYEHIIGFSGRGESFAAIVRKDKETVSVVYNGRLGAPYTNIPLLVWDETGKNIAYPARRKGGWSGVVWNDKESDHYEYPQHITFSPDGKALLFFARRRDGWYAVLNDQPIPESLCSEILTPPVFDEKSRSFYYLYRRDKEVREARLTIEG
ncbi:MAG: hypothetical protein RQ993_02240 [Bacteroidota bacterium]|nr:hypothetical protein [Bacteroidota bacterium]